jgi:hypothetical protein
MLLIAMQYPDTSQLLVLASMAYPVLYLTLSLWLDRS